MRRLFFNESPADLSTSPRPTAAGLIQPHRNPIHVAVWLLVVCAMIYGVIAIGGYTRLTGSGLSMVDWNPVSGVVPPMTDRQWNAEFKHYQQFPEYRTVTGNLSLEGFKRIFWIEFAHRIAARLVGIAFLIPFLFFLLRGYLTTPMGLRLAVVFLLGGLQGLLGWFMVQSGLISDPSVSQYRLTAHLSLAVLLYSYILWLGVGLLGGRAQPSHAGDHRRLLAGVVICIVLVAIMQVSGGFMAGTHAGYVVNTFPHMNSEWIPDMLFSMTPLWSNFFENVIAIQFFHRWVAVAALVAIFVLWSRRFSMRRCGARMALDIVMIVAVCQFLLGIATLVGRVQLPVALAHQTGFVALLSALVIFLRLVASGSDGGRMAADPTTTT